MDEATRQEIKARVGFPISKHGPFERKFPEETTLGVVLADAMKHFDVEDDSQFTYVLAHKGHEESPTTTIGSIAGHDHEVRFTLVKKITQG